MSRSTLKLIVVLLVVVGTALAVFAAGTARTTPEPPKTRSAPARIDAAVPKQLSTATFGMG